MEYYSGIKKKLLIYATTQMDLNGIMLSEKKAISKCHPSTVLLKHFYNILEMTKYRDRE